MSSHAARDRAHFGLALNEQDVFVVGWQIMQVVRSILEIGILLDLAYKSDRVE